MNFFDQILFRRHLEEEEKIIFTVHKHWFSHYQNLFKTAFFGIATPWLLYALFPPLFWIAIVWSILGYLKFMYVVADWYADALILTTDSIIYVEWNGFFHHSASRISYLDVTGVSYEVKGFWGTVFNFGDFIISTSSGNNTTLPYANKPNRAEIHLNKIQSDKADKKKLSDSSKLKDLIADLVAANME